MYNEGGVTHTIMRPSGDHGLRGVDRRRREVDHRQLQGRRRHHGRSIIAQGEGHAAHRGDDEPSPGPWSTTSAGVAVYLLPLDATITAPVQRRLGALYEVRKPRPSRARGRGDARGSKDPHDDRRGCAAGLAAWDTPGIGWQFSADPIRALHRRSALLEAAETCRREMLNVSTLRLGIDSDLIVAVYRAMNGRRRAQGRGTRPGEDSPAES